MKPPVSGGSRLVGSLISHGYAMTRMWEGELQRPKKERHLLVARFLGAQARSPSACSLARPKSNLGIIRAALFGLKELTNPPKWNKGLIREFTNPKKMESRA